MNGEFGQYFLVNSNKFKVPVALTLKSIFGKFLQTIMSTLDFFILLIINSKEHDREDEHQIINEEINLNERI